MSTSKFKVGDRVVAVAPHDGKFPVGCGTVMFVEIDGEVTVEFDTWEEGHQGAGARYKEDHCWCYYGAGLEKIKLVEEEPIAVTNPLYHYRASEETGNDAWGTLAKAVAHNTSWPDVKQQFKDWEVEYTSVTSLPLPHAWRSAKSVIKRAFEHGIPIVQPGGEARGKTAVEKDIKAAKEKDKEVLTPQETLDRMLDRAVNYASQHNLPFTASYTPETLRSVITRD